MSDAPSSADHSWLAETSHEPAAVSKQYDLWADTYDGDLAAWRYDAPLVAARAAADHRSVHRLSGPVLDAGCGTGLVGQALADVGAGPFDGLDVSSASIARADRRGVYRTLIEHDLTHTPWPVATDGYDAAVCVGVLTYVPDTQGLLHELCRVVRSGGLVFVTQRDDLWHERNMEGLLAELQAAGSLASASWTEPRPYLPGNADFADRIGVRYVTGIVGLGIGGPGVSGPGVSG